MIWRPVLGLVVGAVVLVLSSSSVAHAHDASGLMTIDASTVGVQTSDGAPGELTVTVRITYANDGDAAPGAVATATATEAGGAVAAPVTLADAGDGTYTGALLVPTHGSWTVRVESTNPVAAAEQTVDVVGSSTTTSSSTTSTTLAGMKESTSSKSGDDTTTVVIVAIVAVIVAAGLTAWLIMRSRRRSEPD